MATETLVRPTQTIRRKESSRPLINNKRGPDAELTSPAAKRSRTLCEPFVRDSQFILKKHRGKPPSLKIHLHATHFRFDGQDGSFAYDSPMRLVLKHLRLQTVPHDMLEELIGSGVAFYDGCLIVEIHNHRDIEGQKNGARAVPTGEDNKKFSIHNWNPHVTPSSGTSFPEKSQLEPDSGSAESDVSPEQTKAQDKAEPAVTTIVLHPTEQTLHEEMLILAKTPAADARRKKGSDGSLQSASQLTVSATSAGSAGRGTASQKMLLDQGALYSFQGDTLIATEPPLLLDPAENAEHADQILNTLKHPLHSGVPPPAKERKRTTAEMAADDAQAAESERRMLIMDERIKPSARSGAGAASGENQASAASLGFSRFKTIENVKQRLEEQERLNAEKEAQAAQEKRQQEEQAAAQQRLAAQRLTQQQKQREMQEAQARHRQMMMQQKHAAAQAQAQAQQSEMLKRMDAQQNMMQNNHQMQNNAMQNQQNGFQHSQANTMPAQQTPLMAHSSPMLGQNGFSMVPTSSQGAGSPPRPASAALAQGNAIGMSRGGSQQTQNSLHNTPHMPQNGTPSLPNDVPNRNMNHTPHLNPSSPMVGTPTNNMAMPNARLNGNLDTVQQNLMLQQMQQNNQQMNGGQNVPNGGQANGMQGNPAMTPERFQITQQMSHLQDVFRNAQTQAQQAFAVGNQSAAQQLMGRANAAQARFNALRNRLMSAQANGSPLNMQGAHNAGHPNGMQQANGNNTGTGTPVNNAAVPNQQVQQLAVQQQHQNNLTPQQQQNLLRSQQELRRLLGVHNGQIPPQVIMQMPQQMQVLLRQHQNRVQQQLQAQARSQQQAHMNGQMGNQGSPQNAAQTAQYMQNMQALRNGLARQMQGQQQANGQVNGGGGMNGNMNMNNMQQFAQQQRQQGQQQNGGVPDLSQSFAAMQNAMARGHGGQ